MDYIPQIVHDKIHNMEEDFRAFRENIFARLDLLEEALPPEAAREAGRLRRVMEINEFRAGRGA